MQKNNTRNLSSNSILSTVIIGSFRKHLILIQNLKELFELHKILVLSPPEGPVIDSKADFIVFQSDPVSDPKILQDAVFAKIRCSSFVVLANIDGYIGTAALIEIGYALSIGLSIFTLEPINNPHLFPYCRNLNESFPGIYSAFSFRKNLLDKIIKGSLL